jgi:hypothetical protein
VPAWPPAAWPQEIERCEPSRGRRYRDRRRDARRRGAEFDLIDEYGTIVYPVLVGGGTPFFPRRERRVDLELVETRTFSSRFVYVHYRAAR